jgi:hypothetical protein
MSKILELYKAAQSSLGIDKISYEAGKNAQTPYSTNDLKKVDDQILTADRFKVGRTGVVTGTKYSDSVKK